MSKRLNMSNDEAVEWLLSLKNLDICGENRKTAIDKAIQALEQQPCEDCISREAVLDVINFEDEWLFDAKSHNADTKIAFSAIKSKISELPSVTPKYSDEEIDKAQAVEQAYVDKMVELAVEEIKERYSDAIGKMKKAIDEMTEIHSDGEFYIKNVDAKWIISKYLCGGEDETNN